MITVEQEARTTDLSDIYDQSCTKWTKATENLSILSFLAFRWQSKLLFPFLRFFRSLPEFSASLSSVIFTTELYSPRQQAILQLTSQLVQESWQTTWLGQIMH